MDLSLTIVPESNPVKKKLVAFFCLILGDLLVIFLSFTLAYIIRGRILVSFRPEFSALPLPSLMFYFSHFYMAIVWILVFANGKLYTKRYPIWVELKVLVKTSTFSSLVIIIVIFITRREHLFSRTVVILAWLISLVLFPLVRSLFKRLLIELDLWKKKLIIVGLHPTSVSVIRNIRKYKTMGYEVMAIIDDDPEKIGKSIEGVKILGPFSRLDDIVRFHKSKDIIITTPHLSRKKLKEIISRCEALCDSMWLIPRSGDFITEGIEIEVLGDILSLYVKRNLDKPWNIFIKFIFGKTLTVLLLLLASPVFALIALAVKLDSQGPVFFIQKRIGRNLKEFNLYKFRSMHVGNQKLWQEHLDSHPQAKQEWEEFRKLKSFDPRITRVGRIIRKLSLDELPQLINVLEGKMSLVGPRPYLPEEIVDEEQITKIITRVNPGITGPWQVSGRSDVSFQERLKIDENYIRNWSLWLDIVILLKSVKAVFSRSGAF
jgi:Undecaprenyl-phosphate galactose phosphotransferase WbaP